MRIYVSGSILLFVMSFAAYLSGFFVFGEGHAQRPIIFFVSLMFLGFLAYFFTWLKFPKSVSKAQIVWIFLIAVLCRLVFFPSSMIQESDAYRYVWDGQAVLHQLSPYDESPKQAMNEGWAADIVKENQMAATVGGRINFPSIKTIYPPLAQYVFALSQGISDWDFKGLKLLIFLAEMGILFLIWKLIKKEILPLSALLLYGWCPLIIKEYSNSLHVDVFAVLGLMFSIYFIFKDHFFWSVISLAAAFLVKLFPIIFLPFFLVYGFRKWGLRKAVQAGCLFVGLVLLAYVPFLMSGKYLFEGLSIFLEHWKVNAGLFSIIAWGVSNFSENSAVGAKLISLFLFSSLWIVSFLQVYKNGSPKSLVTACLVAVTSLFLLSATGNPWYFPWVFAFLLFFRSFALTFLSGLLFLYYFDFYFLYRGQPHLFKWVMGVEYGVFYFLLIGELWIKRSQWISWFRFSTKPKLSSPASNI